MARLNDRRFPAQIKRIWRTGALFRLLFPSVELTTLAKGA